MKCFRTRYLFACAAAAATAAVLFAGPLTPPPGAIAPTMKTLVEVEPRTAVNATNTPGDNDATPSLLKISQPGSYYLMGNLAGVPGRIGIEIAALGVTLDLRGFEIVGVPGSLDGIRLTVASARNIRIHNGIVRSFDRDGVYLANAAPGARIDTVSAVDCTGIGINAGASALIKDCTASNNTGGGISAGAGAAIINCLAEMNANTGISAQGDAAITGCTARSNASRGFFAASGSITNCAAANNSGVGFVIKGACAFAHCAATSNSSHGLQVSGSSSITGSAFNLNGGDGLNTAGGVTIADCTAIENVSDGFAILNASSISGCTASGNGANGIAAEAECFIRDNLCEANAGSGIFINHTRNRIRGNHCSQNGSGIRVLGQRNILTENTCSINTTQNWAIFADNYYGPIIDRTLVPTPGMGGNSDTGNLSSSDPHANFTY